MDFLKVFGQTDNSQRSFTLIEVLVGTFVFLIVSLSIYGVYTSILEAVHFSRVKLAMAALANEQFEIARNLPYADVGTTTGIPSGKIPSSQVLSRDGKSFSVETTVRNIDDSFDGTIGGTPNDLSPADYKIVEIEIACISCNNSQPINFTTYVAPKNLESASTNGALFVQVFDAVGQPVQGADVHIENNIHVPAIVVDDTTNNDGLLQIVDAPPGAEAYEITVSKDDYSTEQTYQTGDVANPNPAKPHATVAQQELTQISFAIDRVSTLDISTVTENCSPVSDVNFSIAGSKTIGTDNDGNGILKYSDNLSTDSFGKNIISDLEWDAYNLELADLNYDLIGTTPLLPIGLNPDSYEELKLIVLAKDPRSFLITVKDASTLLPISDAEVNLENESYGETYNETLYTGRGFLRQSDWSGGIGPAENQYSDSDENIEIANPVGQIGLKEIFSGPPKEYASSGYLVSSTFDTGSASNFGQIIWQPQTQQPGVGADSVRFQIAANNDNTTWNFVGPDGTSGSYYILANTNINSIHNDNRYIRYKLFLQTEDTAFTPIISDVAITFTSLCVPPGQVVFSGLDSGNYNLTVSKSGYEGFNEAVNIFALWETKEIVLTP